MEGDKKQTPGKWLDEMLTDQTYKTVKITVTFQKPKAESPKPVKPRK